MRFAATVLAPLAAICFLAGCHPVSPASRIPSAPVLSADALLPSPRLIIGRVVAVDPSHAFAILELASDAPAGAVAEGAELMTRTLGLKETGRLRASRYIRGRALGSKIVDGQPSPGDEVVWLAP